MSHDIEETYPLTNTIHQDDNIINMDENRGARWYCDACLQGKYCDRIWWIISIGLAITSIFIVVFALNGFFCPNNNSNKDGNKCIANVTACANSASNIVLIKDPNIGPLINFTLIESISFESHLGYSIATALRDLKIYLIEIPITTRVVQLYSSEAVINVTQNSKSSLLVEYDMIDGAINNKLPNCLDFTQFLNYGYCFTFSSVVEPYPANGEYDLIVKVAWWRRAWTLSISTL